MLRFDRKQQNSIKQLSVNKKIKRKKCVALPKIMVKNVTLIRGYFSGDLNEKNKKAVISLCKET